MVATYIAALRRFSHDVRMYLITSTLIGFSYMGFVSVLLNLYLLRLDYDPVFIGLSAGSTALAFAVSSLPAGAFGSRWGNRRMVIVGVGLVGTATGLLPVAELLPPALQPGTVIATRWLSGFGFALYSVNSNPYLVAVTPPEDRNYVFSIQIALSALAGFIGSLIAGLMPSGFATLLDVTLEHPAPYRYPLLTASVMMCPAVVALFTTSEFRTPQRKPEERLSKRGGLSAPPFFLIAILGITGFMRNGSESAARSFFNIYLDAGLGVSTAWIGVLTAFGQVMAVPAALISPLVVARSGKVWTVVLGATGIVLSLLLMAFVPHWTTAGLGFLGVIAMRSMTRAVISVYQMEIVTPDWRSLTSGTVSAAMGLGFSTMALGGGYIIVAMGYRGLFLVGAALATIGALLFWGYFRIPRGEYARAST
ncbi:MFS transporter [Chloroflexi bacterium TSY]|nr:MFS transporter [Chloroflexi bacterium TSY]